MSKLDGINAIGHFHLSVYHANAQQFIQESEYLLHIWTVQSALQVSVAGYVGKLRQSLEM